MRIPIKKRVTCTSRNVAYMVECTLCNQRGVGEAGDPVQRLVTYIQAARDGVLPANNACAIHRHFLPGDHSLANLRIVLLDTVPASGIKHRFALMPAIRLHLEARWIKKLKAELNVKRNLRFSFSGWLAARRF